MGKKRTFFFTAGYNHKKRTHGFIYITNLIKFSEKVKENIEFLEIYNFHLENV
jgi:hypothetical protein